MMCDHISETEEFDAIYADEPAPRPSPESPAYAVRRETFAGVRYSIEYGDHRCHVDRREPPTTRRMVLPDGWHGTVDDAQAYFERMDDLARAISVGFRA